MKSIIFVLFFVFFINLLNAQTIFIKIEGVEEKKGNILVALHNSKDNFMVKSKRFKSSIIDVNKSKLECKFEDIPEGVYAIAAFHDVNGNKELDKNWFGVPTEKYGFSLNRYGSFGPPGFEKVSFELKEGENKELVINLK